MICKCPSKQLHSVTNQLLGRTKKTLLPNNIPANDPPDALCLFFNNTVEQFRNYIDIESADTPVFEPFTGLEFCDRSSHSSADFENCLKKLISTLSQHLSLNST